MCQPSSILYLCRTLDSVNWQEIEATSLEDAAKRIAVLFLRDNPEHTECVVLVEDPGYSRQTNELPLVVQQFRVSISQCPIKAEASA